MSSAHNASDSNNTSAPSANDHENQDQNTLSPKSDADSSQPIPPKSHSQPPPPSSPPTLPPHSNSAIDDSKQSQSSDSNSNSVTAAMYTGFSALSNYMGYGANADAEQENPSNSNLETESETHANDASNGPRSVGGATQSLSAIDRSDILSNVNVPNGAPPLTHVQSAPLPSEQKEEVDEELFTVCPETVSENENEQTAARDSDLFAVLDRVSVSGLDNEWTKGFTEPSSESVLLRSLTYTADGRKETNGPAVFRLAAAQSFKTEVVMDHVAMHPSSWYNQNIALEDMSTFTIIVHLQVKSLKLSFISYHCLCGEALMGYNARGTPIVRGDRAVTRLLDLVLNCADENVRNNRLKLIPRIVEGPYPVKRVVENRPVLLGNKIKQTYFRGPNYFEIDSKVDESMVAASIIKLCHRFAKRIVVDMAWTIQGEDIEELPERLLCACSVHNMDFGKVKEVHEAMQHCHRLKYKGTKGDEEEEDEEETEQVSDEK